MSQSGTSHFCSLFFCLSSCACVYPLNSRLSPKKLFSTKKISLKFFFIFLNRSFFFFFFFFFFFLQVDASPYVGHSASVEDLQWSNTEENVFASCSVDCSVKIFDVRRKTAPMLSVDGVRNLCFCQFYFCFFVFLFFVLTVSSCSSCSSLLFLLIFFLGTFSRCECN